MLLLSADAIKTQRSPNPSKADKPTSKPQFKFIPKATAKQRRKTA